MTEQISKEILDILKTTNKKHLKVGSLKYHKTLNLRKKLCVHMIKMTYYGIIDFMIKDMLFSWV